MVFTFKGPNVADAILRFAREYRVGQIVIGRPGRIPWWRRLQRYRNVAEELIHRAKDATVVVLDTEAETRQVGAVERAASLSLSSRSIENLLNPWRIVLWEVPVSKDEVQRRLVEVIAADTPEVKVQPTLEKLQAREEQGSTFLNEGVGLPHAWVEGLSGPQVALGLTRCGVTGVDTEVPIEAVFLLLSPPGKANLHLQVLASGARLLQSPELRRHLFEARTPEEAMEVIRAHEIRSRVALAKG
jgi:mannitol/fructose-specific phosphotransferase system IIA component (Ntr-type)